MGRGAAGLVPVSFAAGAAPLSPGMGVGRRRRFVADRVRFGPAQAAGLGGRGADRARPSGGGYYERPGAPGCIAAAGERAQGGGAGCHL